ncbi:hypothetical protein Purlil1_12140 [Purpureocillium lilacinum]|uniref:Uncharacterized protein n=1 Tax=Purpureocillium lilacinum TaxID=33203 RepID=A0ABR0BI89_PURLI|nr:hypothetical protein Purlil1_12140 [Purpureocillium lilacinum]
MGAQFWGRLLRFEALQRTRAGFCLSGKPTPVPALVLHHASSGADFYHSFRRTRCGLVEQGRPRSTCGATADKGQQRIGGAAPWHHAGASQLSQRMSGAMTWRTDLQPSAGPNQLPPFACCCWPTHNARAATSAASRAEIIDADSELLGRMTTSPTTERYSRHSRRFRLLAAGRFRHSNAGGLGHEQSADGAQVPTLAVASSAMSRTPPPPPPKRQKLRDSDLPFRRGMSPTSSRGSPPPDQEPEQRPRQRNVFPLFGMTSDAAAAGQTEKLQKIMMLLREGQAATRRNSRPGRNRPGNGLPGQGPQDHARREVLACLPTIPCAVEVESADKIGTRTCTQLMIVRLPENIDDCMLEGQVKGPIGGGRWEEAHGAVPLKGTGVGTCIDPHRRSQVILATTYVYEGIGVNNEKELFDQMMMFPFVARWKS